MVRILTQEEFCKPSFPCLDQLATGREEALDLDLDRDLEDLTLHPSKYLGLTFTVERTICERSAQGPPVCSVTLLKLNGLRVRSIQHIIICNCFEETNMDEC
jgi:hypothetical protein